MKPRHYAIACGYIPISEYLGDGEYLTEIATIGNEGEFLALTSTDEVLYVTHWYGDSDYISVPCVALPIEKVLGDSGMADGFIKCLEEIPSKHFPAELRWRIKKIISDYKPQNPSDAKIVN